VAPALQPSRHAWRRNLVAKRERRQLDKSRKQGADHGEEDSGAARSSDGGDDARSALGRVALGSVVSEVVSKADAPVMLTRAGRNGG
jgi:hypothetical protein